jgi:phage baseplate assembly protein gpV
MHELSNAVRQQAQAAMGEYSWPQIGTISSYDASAHAVKVSMQPSGQESGWMPLGAIGIGNGWGVAVGPQIGDQVLVVFEHGDYSSGTIVARIFSVQQQAPAVPSGEIWAVHSTGAFVKLVNSGDVDVNAIGNLNVTVTGSANVSAQQINATASTSASVTAPAINLGASGQSLLSFVTSAFMNLFNNHTHPVTGVQTGGSSVTSSAPNQQMGSGHLTSTVQGG